MCECVGIQSTNLMSIVHGVISLIKLAGHFLGLHSHGAIFWNLHDFTSSRNTDYATGVVFQNLQDYISSRDKIFIAEVISESEVTTRSKAMNCIAFCCSFLVSANSK